MMKKLVLILLVISWMSYSMAAVAQDVPAKKTTHVQQQPSKSHHAKHRRKQTHTTHSSAKQKKSPHATTRRVQRHHNAPKPNINNHPAEGASRFGFVASIGHSVVDFVHRTVDTLRYSAYKLGGRRFDTSRGIYILDCSDYVDNILQAVYPSAYGNLVNSTGSEKPTSQHFYNFFSNLPERTNHYWNRIDDVEDLQPGDILVFRTKNRFGNETGGHVMVVMNRPVPDDDAFVVRVADSAPVAHSQDTRPAHSSGVGIGNLVLKVDPKTGEPFAYAWKVGSRWKQNVNFAMARPVNASG